METHFYPTYAEAQDAVTRFQQEGRNATILNEHTGGMRDVNEGAGFKVLVEAAPVTPIPQEEPGQFLRDLPRNIAWLFIVAAALIFFAMGFDWIVNSGRKAITILLLGSAGTIAAFIAAVMWSIVLGDLSKKFRK